MALLDTLQAATQLLSTLTAKLNTPPIPPTTSQLTPADQAAVDALQAEVTKDTPTPPDA